MSHCRAVSRGFDGMKGGHRRNHTPPLSSVRRLALGIMALGEGQGQTLNFWKSCEQVSHHYAGRGGAACSVHPSVTEVQLVRGFEVSSLVCFANEPKPGDLQRRMSNHLFRVCICSNVCVHVSVSGCREHNPIIGRQFVGGSCLLTECFDAVATWSLFDS